MDINKKIKVISIMIALTAVLCSVIVTVNTRVKKEDESAKLAEIQKEMEEQEQLDIKLKEAEDKLSVDEKIKTYITFYEGTGDVTDEIKGKKAELKANSDTIKTKAETCGKELEKIYNSVGFTVNERITMIDEFYANERYKSLSDTLSKCESLKTEIEGAVKAYNDEQEAKKKAAAQSNNSSNNNSKQGSSNRSSGSSSSGNYSRGYSSGGGSSSGGSYSSSSETSSGGGSSSGGSYSSSSETSSGGGSSDAGLGSER